MNRNRGREGRIIRLLSDTKDLPHGSNYAFGVDENTALVVTHLGKNEAKGRVSYNRLLYSTLYHIWGEYQFQSLCVFYLLWW